MKTPKTWLDELPIDICARISSFLPEAQPWTIRRSYNNRVHESSNINNPPALILAALSDHQRQAVRLAQSRILRIEPTQRAKPSYQRRYKHLLRQWCGVLCNDIREVYIPQRFPALKKLTTVLALPSINKAAVPYIPTFLQSFISARSITVLELQPTHHGPVQGNRRNALPELLRTCPIQRLVLRCHWCSEYIDYPQNCFATMLLDGMSNEPAPTSLRFLHIICPSSRLEPATAAVRFFPDLEEFILEHVSLFDDNYLATPVQMEFSPAFEERLPTLRSVGMIHCGAVEDLVPVLGTRLTTLHSREICSSQGCLALSVCENLKSIDLALAEGLEGYFPKNICSLRSISLTWCTNQLNDVHAEYYSPGDEDFLIDLVSRNKDLKKLQLDCVKISHRQLESMLSNIGKNLQTLRLPIFHQGVFPVDRFHEVIRLIVAHNSDLSELEFCRTSCDLEQFELLVDNRDASCCDSSLYTFCTLHLRPIDRVMRVLRLRVPKLSADSLRNVELAFL